jgi:hypothetical protein
MFVSEVSLWGAAIAASFVANILAGVIALRMVRK